MAVHGEHAQHLRVLRPLDAGNVVRGLGQAHFLGRALGEVEDVHRNLAVVFPGFGVLERVRIWVERAVDGHVELSHRGFVKFQVGQALPVARPKQRLVVPKFLFVHPVGGPVDDVVELAVCGHGGFFARGEVGDVDVVVPHESDFVSRGGELREALLASAEVGDRPCGGGRGHVVDVEVGEERVAVKPFAFGGQHHKTLVAAEFVAAEPEAGVFKRRHRCQQGVHGLARFVRPLHNACAEVGVAFLGGVVFAVGHGADAPHVFGPERAAGPNGFVAECGVLSK